MEVLRGSAEGMGDDGIETHRPKKPGDPHNKVEGTRVEAVETAMSKDSRSVEEDPGEVGHDENQPGKFKEPPDELQVKLRDPTGFQVEPGGETGVERDESAPHKDADARTNGMAEEAHDDVQDEAERSATCRNASIKGERGSALAQGQSTTADEPTDQRTSTIVDDVPEDPPVPPPPLERPPNAENETPSVELEGERISHVSCDDKLTGGDADASGPSVGDEDARKQLKNLWNVSERELKGSERRT